MFTAEDYSYLEQVIDSTWGQSSTEASPTMSVKMQVTGESTAVIKYATVISFHGVLRQDRVEHEREIAEKTIDAYIKATRKAFLTLAGHAIKMKLVNLEPDVDVTDVNPHRQQHTAYFRCVGLVELS
jgi:hypothetical protein